MIRLFLVAAYYRSYKGIFQLMSPSWYFAQKVVLPLSQLSFFTLVGAVGGTAPLEYYLVGNAMAVASISAVFSVSRAVTAERYEGTLPYLLTSPINRIPILLGSASVQIVDGIANVFVAFAWAVLAFHLSIAPGLLLSLAVVVVMGTLSLSGLGLLVGTVGYVVLDSAFLANATIFAVLLLSGANIPLTDLPLPARILGEIVPFTRSISAARAVIGGADIVSVVPSLLGDLALGGLYAATAVVQLAAIERASIRNGALERM